MENSSETHLNEVNDIVLRILLIMLSFEVMVCKSKLGGVGGWVRCLTFVYIQGDIRLFVGGLSLFLNS